MNAAPCSKAYRDCHFDSSFLLLFKPESWGSGLAKVGFLENGYEVPLFSSLPESLGSSIVKG